MYIFVLLIIFACFKHILWFPNTGGHAQAPVHASRASACCAVALARAAPHWRIVEKRSTCSRSCLIEAQNIFGAFVHVLGVRTCLVHI